VRLIDLGAPDQEVRRLPCSSSPTWTTFSPDGRRLAVVGFDGAVQLFDAFTGQAVLTLRGLSGHRPGDYASAARGALSPDGRLLASSNWDGSVNVFDTGELSDEERKADFAGRVPVWHMRQAREALVRQDRFAFDFHWKRLQEKDAAAAGLLA